MYEAIQGILKEKEPFRAVVETGGIFYRLSIPLSTYAKLPVIDTPIYLFLACVVREDAHTLYAFAIKEERDLFETLITISGIGPKTALGIIGHMELEAFERALGSSDIRILSKLPGIGKKTAERLVIEMRDKIKKKLKSPLLPSNPNSNCSLQADAVSALLNLGYHLLDAQKAVNAAMPLKTEDLDLGSLIAAALQKM